MKKNFVKIFVCALAMSTMCSVTTASAYTNGLTDALRENVSEELKSYILNSNPVRVVNDNCKVYSICYTGLDENGKETYDFCMPDENGDCIIPALAVLVGFNENGKEIRSGYYDHLVFFDEQGNLKIGVTTNVGRIGDYLVHKTIDVVTGKDILVIAENDFGANVITKCVVGDTNCDGTVDVRDVTSINQHIIKENIFPDYADIVADVNDDGNIDISDLGMLKKYVIKMIDSF